MIAAAARSLSWGDARRAVLMLNPGGDLKKTEERLKPILQPKIKKLGWRGAIGKPIPPAKLRSALERSDLYIYCGHGAGDRYIGRDSIADMRGCAVSLLFGCSSGCLRRQGTFEPTGTVISYLMAGSPAVLANLWDVTDGESDRMTAALLRCWLEDHPGESLCEAAVRARAACQLPHLTAAAAVCYGVPVRADGGDES